MLPGLWTKDLTLSVVFPFFIFCSPNCFFPEIAEHFRVQLQQMRSVHEDELEEWRCELVNHVRQILVSYVCDEIVVTCWIFSLLLNFQ